jgi:hypothetical protein
MLCSEPKLDSHRFKDIIDEAIAEGKHLVAVAAVFFKRFHSDSFIQ